ncbi:MAG: AraC family transcriptional regulator [Ekhidna sp.]|nr:AraC family transcriptional regulator [Ekhidna sp.]
MSQFLNILEFIVTSNFLLIGFYLVFNQNSRNIGVKFLGVFLILFGIHYLMISLGDSKLCCNELLGFWFDYKIWSFFSFLFGPSVYLFTTTYTNGDLALDRKKWLHLAGLAISILHQFNSESLMGYAFYDWTYLGFLAEMHNLSYALFSFALLGKLNEEKYQNHKKLLLHVCAGYLVMVVVWILFEITNYFSILSPELIRLSFLVFLYYYVGRLSFLCIRYPDIINKSKYIRSRLNEWSEEKYQNTRIEDNYANKVLDSLKKYIEIEENYTNSELKLKTVSDDIGFPTKDISQVVNIHLSKSFSEYLNEHRIAAATRLLSSENDMNVSEVMYKVGFNSKSLFFKYFKTTHGKTPSEFKKQTPTAD